jgi:hypothetical protein
VLLIEAVASGRISRTADRDVHDFALGEIERFHGMQRAGGITRPYGSITGPLAAGTLATRGRR